MGEGGGCYAKDMKIFPTEMIVKGDARIVAGLVSSLEQLRENQSLAHADFSLRALAEEGAEGRVCLSGWEGEDIVFATLDSEISREGGGGVWAHYANENHLFFLMAVQLWIIFGRGEKGGLHFSLTESQLSLVGGREFPLGDVPMIQRHEIYQQLLHQCEQLQQSGSDQYALELVQREIKDEMDELFRYALKLSRLRRAGLTPQLSRSLRQADAGALTEALAELGEIAALGMDELPFAIAYHLLDGSRPRDERRAAALACYERYFALASATSECADRHDDCALLCKEGGDVAGAIEHGQAAVALYRQLGAASDLANALNNLGNFHSEAGEYARAEEAYSECLRLYELQPDEHVEDLAALHSNRGLLYKGMLRAEDAEHSFTQARDLYAQLVEGSPQDELFLMHSAVSQEMLAEFALAREDDPAAAEAYQSCWRRIAQLKEAGHEVALTDEIRIAQGLARVSVRQGKPEQAEKLLLRVHRLYEELVTTYGRREDILSDQAQACCVLGNLQDDMRKHSAAEKSMRQSIALYEELTEQKPEVYKPELAMVCYNLSQVYNATQRAKLAERALLRSLRLFDAHLKEHPEGWQFEYAMLLNNLAAHYGRQDKPRKGEGYMESAVVIRERIAQQDPELGLPVLIESLLNREAMHAHRGRTEEAIADGLRAVSLAEQLVASDPSEGAAPLALSLMELGRVYGNADRYAEAREVWIRSRALYEEIYPDAEQREHSPIPMLTEWIEMISEEGEYLGERPRLFTWKNLWRSLLFLLALLWFIALLGRLLWGVAQLLFD